MKKVLVVAAILVAGVAAADVAARFWKIMTKDGGTTALTEARPSTLTAGQSLSAPSLSPPAPQFRTTKVWCEFETQGTGVTGGRVDWWRASQDGGWAMCPGCSETLSGLDGGQKRVATLPLSLAGDESRIVCQPVGFTETGAGLDGGLRRTYQFRLEAP